MPLTPVQRLRLEKYRKIGDRGVEPVYVGREDLFRLVADNADAVANGDVAGRTVCIAGPPGVGKTAFLAALAGRSSESGWGGPKMLCVKMPVDALRRGTAAIVDELAKALPEPWRPPTKFIPYVLGKLGVGSFQATLPGQVGGVGLTPEDGERPPSEAVDFPWRDMPRLLGRVPPDMVVCLYVDEAHGLQASAGDRNVAAASLHEGPPDDVSRPGRRLFAVFAGHTHTPDVLRPSISKRFRDGNVHYMGNLSEDESLRYVFGTLDRLGVLAQDINRKPLAHWTVGECGGFPHHLRSAMESIAEGLLQADGLSLAGLDGEFVSQRLRARRERYYGVRTDGVVDMAAPQLGALLRDWSRRSAPVTKAQGRRDLSHLLAGLPEDVRADMAKRGVASGDDLLEEMVGNGALMTDRSGGGCRCPIDSLIGWLRNGEHAGKAPFPRLAVRSPR